LSAVSVGTVVLYHGTSEQVDWFAALVQLPDPEDYRWVSMHVNLNIA
jgi:hypothetical protein